MTISVFENAAAPSDESATASAASFVSCPGSSRAALELLVDWLGLLAKVGHCLGPLFLAHVAHRLKVNALPRRSEFRLHLRTKFRQLRLLRMVTSSSAWTSAIPARLAAVTAPPPARQNQSRLLRGPAGRTPSLLRASTPDRSQNCIASWGQHLSKWDRRRNPANVRGSRHWVDDLLAYHRE